MTKDISHLSITPDDKQLLGVKPTPKDFLNNLITIQGQLLTAMSQPLVDIPPLIRWGDKPMFWPHTYNCISGQTGTHKSRYFEHFMAMLITNQTYFDYNITSPFENLDIALIDTERNLKYQLPYALQAVRNLSGIDTKKVPDNFFPTSLIDIPRADRFDASFAYIQHINKKRKHHLCVFIDVATDMIMDFNDVGLSNQFIDHVNWIINREEITFFFVIHENPGQGNNKAKGHLGSMLMEKASTAQSLNFVLDQNHNRTGAICVTTRKIRSGELPDKLYIEYDAESKTLITADDDITGTSKTDKTMKASIGQVTEMITENMIKPTSQIDLICLIRKKFNVSKNTALQRIKTIHEEQIVFKDQFGNDCKLHSAEHGKKLIYSLVTNSGMGQIPDSDSGEYWLGENGDLPF